MSRKHPHLEHDLVAVSLIPAAAWFVVRAGVQSVARPVVRRAKRAARDAHMVAHHRLQQRTQKETA